MKRLELLFFGFVCPCIAALAFCLCFQSQALAFDFNALVKRVGRCADNVEIKHLDEFAQQPATVKAGRDIVQRNAGKMDEVISRDRLLRALRTQLADVDTTLYRQLDELDDASLQAAIVLSSGAHNVKRGIPDIARRSQFLQEGGGETLCTIGRHADLMEDAIRFDTALKAGKLPSPPGMKSLALKDFGAFFYEQGDRAHHFWQTYVRPHWKLWLGGSALTAVMLAPDEYLDHTGDLTKGGLKKITTVAGDLLGKALAGTVEGVGEGAKQVARESSEAFFRTFFTSTWGILSLVLISIALLLLVPATRRRVIRLCASSRQAQPLQDEDSTSK